MTDTTQRNATSCPHPWADELLDACRELLVAPDLDEALDRITVAVAKASGTPVPPDLVEFYGITA